MLHNEQIEVADYDIEKEISLAKKADGGNLWRKQHTLFAAIRC